MVVVDEKRKGNPILRSLNTRDMARESCTLCLWQKASRLKRGHHDTQPEPRKGSHDVQHLAHETC